VTIEDLMATVPSFAAELRETKLSLAPEEFWYPYDTLANVGILSLLLPEGFRDLTALVDGGPIADIGGADGDLAFLLESAGFRMELIDHGPTNFNGLRGARLVGEARQSKVQIEDVDLDAQFRLPGSSYGLVLFLGILYHLQNPFYVLKQLAEVSRNCVLSTRIARATTDGTVPLELAPVAYLVDPFETNNDPTNYWIFSEFGLRRLLERTGWDVMALSRFGDTAASDPSSAEHDERAFCVLRSRVCGTQGRHSE
jgi:hypothetical protein